MKKILLVVLLFTFISLSTSYSNTTIIIERCPTGCPDAIYKWNAQNENCMYEGTNCKKNN